MVVSARSRVVRGGWIGMEIRDEMKRKRKSKSQGGGGCVPGCGGEAEVCTGDFDEAFVVASGGELPMAGAGKRRDRWCEVRQYLLFWGNRGANTR